jgi:lipopolysaccharide/colanic/teichoic acid biosynthesis glycosyltransferase
MTRRLFDIVSAILGLCVAAPILLLAAIAIRLTSPGPVLYRARRAGLGGRPFCMLKLRTMHVDHAGVRSRITGINDPRIFPVGRILRHLKIDELPQLINVLRGEMSIVGPRPEDPELVEQYYGPEHRETLTVRPGLSSPGSLYHDTHGAPFLTGDDPETRYLERLLQIKLALDLVYVRRASLRYDCAIILRTMATITGRMLGRRHFPDPPELSAAGRFVVPVRARATVGTSSFTPPLQARVGM